MKQIIILLSMIILGIAIASMVLSFEDTARSITNSTRSKMETQLGFDTSSQGENN